MGHYIGYIIFMCIISILVEYLNNRDNISKSPDQTDYNYVVKMPTALKYTYLVMFGVGIFLFVVFLFFFLQGNPTVTVGHLNFAVIFASIGFVVTLWSERWRLVVNNEQLEIHRLFRRPQEISPFRYNQNRSREKTSNYIIWQERKKVINSRCIIR